MGKVLVITGETSGDMHAARVIREIKKLAPDIEFSGMGSRFLEKEGVDILIDPSEISTIGFTEAFRNLKQHLANLKILKEHIDRERPDVLFLVDNSGFNMLMARVGRKKGIPVVNYFSPSAWAWGRWRARWMARNKATIASVFPMEAEVYREAGARVKFVGHPLVDLVKVEKDTREIYSQLELDSSKPVIGLLPGSRRQEIEKLLPVMLKTAVDLQKKHPGLQFILPLAKGINKSRIVDLAAGYNLVLKLVEDTTYEVMKVASLLIVASGTATLEAAILGAPMVIIYRVSWSTYLLGKRLMKLEHIGLPNIIAGKKVVPELIQKQANSEELYKVVQELLGKPYTIKRMKEELGQVKEKLGQPGAVRRTAELVLKEGNLLK